MSFHILFRSVMLWLLGVWPAALFAQSWSISGVGELHQSSSPQLLTYRVNLTDFDFVHSVYRPDGTLLVRGGYNLRVRYSNTWETESQVSLQLPANTPVGNGYRLRVQTWNSSANSYNAYEQSRYFNITAPPATAYPRLALQYWRAGDFPNRGEWTQGPWVDGHWEGGGGHWETDENGNDHWVEDEEYWVPGYYEQIWVPNYYPDGVYGSSWSTTAGTYNIADASSSYIPATADRGLLKIVGGSSGVQLVVRAHAIAPAGNCSNYSVGVFGGTNHMSYSSSIPSGSFKEFTLPAIYDGLFHRVRLQYWSASGVPNSSGEANYYVAWGGVPSVITFSPIDNRTLDDGTFQVPARNSLGEPVSSVTATSGSPHISGIQVTPNFVGNHTLVAQQNAFSRDGISWGAATSPPRSFNVNYNYHHTTVQGGVPERELNATGIGFGISANTPAPGMAFTSWTVVSGNVTIANPSSKNTTAVAGIGGAIVIKANYSNDNRAPSVPSALKTSTIGAGTASLSWNASYDNGVVATYEIWGNGALLATTSQTSINLSNLDPDTLYNFTIVAVDGAGLRSDVGGPYTVRTWRRVLASAGTINSSTPSTSFQFNLEGAGRLRIYTTGMLATHGVLSGPEVFTQYSGNGGNFSVDRQVSSGAYSITVTGQNAGVTGDYQIFAEFGPSLQADFTASQTMGPSPLVVNFDASRSFDPNGNAIVSYQWDFDNNSTIDATGVTASKTYGADFYTARLTVTNSAGVSASMTRRISAKTVPVSISGGTASVSSALVGSAIQVTANAAPSGQVFSAWVGDVCVEDSHSAGATFTVPPNGFMPAASYRPSSVSGPLTNLSIGQSVGLIGQPFSVSATTTYGGAGIAFNNIEYSTDWGATWMSGTLAAGSAANYAADSETTKTLECSFSFHNPGIIIFRARGGIYASNGITGSDYSYRKIVVSSPAEDNAVTVLNATGWPLSGPSGTVISLVPSAGLSGPVWWEILSGGGTFESPYVGHTKFTKGAGPVVLRLNSGYAMTLTVRNGTSDKVHGSVGTEFSITANAAPAGKVFAGWKLVGGGLVLDSTLPTTKYVMGDGGAALEATYVPIGTPRVTLSRSALFALSGVPFVVSATASDSDSNLSSLEIEYSLDGLRTWVAGSLTPQGSAQHPTKWQGTGASASLQATFAHTIGQVQIFGVWYRAVAVDAHGNRAESHPLSVTIGYGPPVTTIAADTVAGKLTGTADSSATERIVVPLGSTFSILAETLYGGVLMSQQIDHSRNGGGWRFGDTFGARMVRSGSLTSLYPDLLPTEHVFRTDDSLIGVGLHKFRARANAGSINSSYAYVTVEVVPQRHPIITGQPISVHAFVGESRSFTVTATDGLDNTSLSYSWRKRGVHLDTPGSEAATLTFSNCQLQDAGDYSVMVYNEDGVTFSRDVALIVSVRTPVIGDDLTVHAVVGQPVSFQIPIVANAASNFSASGLPPGILGPSAGGVLSGTPTAEGVVSSTISASNVYGSSGNKTLTWNIVASPADGTNVSKALVAPEVAEPKSVSDQPALPDGWPNDYAKDKVGSVGSTSVDVRVNSSGEAVARIPIAVTPGVAGMQPTLALAYNHNSGNGYTGVGWAVQGVAMITRRNSVRSTDGEVRSVKMDATDRFALNGQRLVRVSAEVGGVAEYRTEIDSYDRILAYSVASVPTKFEVYTKSGLKMVFGQGDGASSLLTNGNFQVNLVGGGTATAAWGIDSVEDRYGNVMRFYYEKDAALGEFRIKTIKYGPGEKAKVEFNYESAERADKITGFSGGAPWAVTRRLESIEASYDSEIARRYVLEYETSPNSGKSRLNKVTEFGSDGSSLPPTVLAYRLSPSGWGEHNPAFELKHPTNFSLGKNFGGRTGAAFNDIDGDGIPEFLHRQAGGGSATGYIARGSRDGWIDNHNDFNAMFAPRRILGWMSGPRTDLGVRFVDLDSDGYLDMIASRDYDISGESSRKAIWLNRPEGWTQDGTSAKWDPVTGNHVINIGGHGDDERGVRFVDLDGDGRSDVVWSRRSSHVGPVRGALKNTIEGWKPFESPAGYTPDANIFFDPFRYSGVRLVDINSDGLVDMLVNWPDTVTNPVAYINDGSKWVADPAYAPPLPIAYTGSRLGGTEFIDVNGDGLLDQVKSSIEHVLLGSSFSGRTETETWLNTGKGWTRADARFDVKAPLVITSGASSLPHVHFGTAFVDVNGDGLVDMVCANNFALGGQLWGVDYYNRAKWGYPPHKAVYLNTGNGWKQTTSYVPPRYLASVTLGTDLVGEPWPQPGTQMLDVNGDGLVDVVGMLLHAPHNNYMEATSHLNKSVRPDLLEGVTHSSGLLTILTYDELSRSPADGQAGNFYVQGARLTDRSDEVREPGAPPVQNARNARSVVTEMKVSGDVGDPYSLKYRYYHLRYDAKEGSLGFAQVDVTDTRTGLVTATSYRQGYPFIGLADKAAVTTSTGKKVSEVSSAWKSVETVPSSTEPRKARVQSPYVHISVSKSFEPSAATGTGEYLEKVVTIPEGGRNEWGDVINRSTESDDGYASTETKQITYLPLSPTNPFPGQVDKELTLIVGSTQSPLEASSKLRVVKREYNDKGRLKKETQHPKLTTSTQGGLIEETNAGAIAAYLATDEAKALHLETEYAYDGHGNATSIKVSSVGLAAPRETQFKYDDSYGGRFLTSKKKIKTNDESHEEKFENFDIALGLPQTVTDINGLSTQIEYDGFGRTVKTTAPGNLVTTVNRRWALPGQGPATATYHVETIGTGSPPALAFYDALGRPVRTVSVTGDNRLSLIDTAYDSLGRTVSQSRPYFAGSEASDIYHTTTQYDEIGRPKTVSHGVSEGGQGPAASGGQSTFTYAGLASTETRALVSSWPALNVTQTRSTSKTVTRNGLGGITSIVESGVASTNDSAVSYSNETLTASLSYYYDGFGVLRKIVDPVGAQTVYTIDAYGRRSAAADPNRGTWTFRHNPLGEPVYQKDAENVETSYLYDKLGRVTKRTVGGLVTDWTYDNAPGLGKGKVASILSFGGHSEAYEYGDNYGQLVKVSRTVSGLPAVYSRTFGYDILQRLRTVSHRVGSSPGFGERRVYGKYGHWVSLRNATTAGRYWLASEFDADGQVKVIGYGNGVVTDRTYLARDGTVDHIMTELPGSTVPIQDLSYFYEASTSGSLYKRVDKRRALGEGFVFDALGRLRITYRGSVVDVTELSPTAISAQTYDLAGNILEKTHVAGGYAYTRPPGQQGGGGAHAIKSIGSRVFEYDDNGNIEKDGVRTIAWSAFNQPSSIGLNGGATTVFTYDASLQRLTQDGGGSKTFYLSPGYERRVANGTTDDVYYLSGPLGLMGQVTWRGGQHADVRYFHHDHLGSVESVTKLDGTSVPQSYDAWGDRRDPATLAQGVTPSEEDRRGFTGHEHLDAVHLVHMNGRIYDPVLGRFLSVDPVFDSLMTTQGVNAYSYVRNNPISYTDPTGLASSDAGSEKSWWQSFWDWATSSPSASGPSITVSGAAINNNTNSNELSAAYGQIKARNYEIYGAEDTAIRNRVVESLGDLVINGTQMAADANPLTNAIQLGSGKELATKRSLGIGDYIIEATGPASKTLRILDHFNVASSARKVIAKTGVSPEVFKKSLKTKKTPSGTAAGAWEIANTGGQNYLIEAGGVQFWADGVMGTTIQEAKFIGNASRSPFVAGSNIPSFIREKIVAQVDDEFARMSRIIADPSNPITNVEVVVSDRAANQFFIDMLKKHGLDGRVINR